MNALFFTVIVALALFPCRLSATDKNPVLKRTAAALAPALAQLDPKAEITFENNGNTLVIAYVPQPYKIHGHTMCRESLPIAHDEIGPSCKGFVLKVSIQRKGEVNQAATPQTLVKPYLKTDIDVTPVDGAPSQLFWGLSYGSRTESNVLSQIRTILSNKNK